MSIIRKEYSFPSHTGNTDIYVQSLAPEQDIKGVIQIIHGMAEHTNRYLEVAEYFCERGYAVIMNDHAGHGKSVKSDDDYGWFCDKDGWKCLVDDLKEVTAVATREFPDKPVLAWGHSMGSFLLRIYLATYKPNFAGAVICGTAGKNPAAPLGIAIANLLCKLKGNKARINLLDKMAFGAYNKRFEGNTGFEWLSVNKTNVEVYVKDDLCGFLFSASAFRDLFTMLKTVSSDDWYVEVSKKIPLYLIAGEEDPVGNYGKGVKEVYNKLLQSGHNVKVKLYPGLRHEIHNEDERTGVYDDILSFANDCIK